MALRLLFDECVAPRLYKEAFGQFLKFCPEIEETKHLIDMQKGAQDDEWVPVIAKDGWIIISTDRGRKGTKGRGERLPIVCKRHNITHVLISGRIQQKGRFEIACSILDVRKKLYELPNEPRGSCFLLKLNPDGPAELIKKNGVMRVRPNRRGSNDPPQ